LQVKKKEREKKREKMTPSIQLYFKYVITSAMIGFTELTLFKGGMQIFTATVFH